MLLLLNSIKQMAWHGKALASPVFVGQDKSSQADGRSRSLVHRVLWLFTLVRWIYGRRWLWSENVFGRQSN
jgi:hypothetical protein